MHLILEKPPSPAGKHCIYAIGENVLKQLSNSQVEDERNYKNYKKLVRKFQHRIIMSIQN